MIDLRCSFLVVSSGKPCAEIEPHLMAEDRARARPGPIAAIDPVGQQLGQKVEILLLGMARRRRVGALG